MITVTLYYAEPDAQYQQALADLEALQETHPHQLITLDVNKDKALRDKYSTALPVVEIGPYRLQPPFTRQDLQIMLSSAQDRLNQLERVDKTGLDQRIAKARTMNSSDKFSNWFASHYLAMANIFLLIYAGLPFLAPVLLRAGATLPATVIYKMYSPLCHQLAFRSWFLFGEQAYYPREMAGIEGLTPYETLQGSDEVDLIAAREFNGNETVGYKVALCQRDVAIYGFMLLFGVVYALVGRRLPNIPWYFWVILGLVPIALDGFSQLPGLANGLPSWIPLRESNPTLRTITGALFGWMTAWYLFPMIEETARETRRIMQRKQAWIDQAGAGANPKQGV